MNLLPLPSIKSGILTKTSSRVWAMAVQSVNAISVTYLGLGVLGSWGLGSERLGKLPVDGALRCMHSSSKTNP